MTVTATRIVEEPITVVSHTREVTGTMPPPPPAPPANTPILIVVSRPTPAPAEAAATEAEPAKLPKTGSIVPAIGLLGITVPGCIVRSDDGSEVALCGLARLLTRCPYTVGRLLNHS